MSEQPAPAIHVPRLWLEIWRDQLTDALRLLHQGGAR